MRALEFFVPGTPAPGGSKRAFVVKGRAVVVDDCKRNKPWRERVTAVAREALDGPLLSGPLELRVVFILPRPKGHFGTGKNAATIKASAPPHPTVKPDTTKLLRALEDALTEVVWRDDTQVVVQSAVKRYQVASGENPGAKVWVEEVA